ncbi:amidohydrolase family protein [Amycolatopsis rubida]|uniref:Amidohydrolase family protein n=1 Tax=Amycolatopsis rubida TaxID=112413 RepID=A0ABX0C7Q1_9PSEU|nr:MULTISPECIES: amidohydrolase family protein [Amycolatopsis]MYW96455.1 amidohydrolase family protein [Amycolatopsis rubida]NEC61442.1 amidohydrolase family protein [Amycolatopsis rubida]OAP28085.1 Amidohydrolase [Amycolatopsis sp. M39]
MTDLLDFVADLPLVDHHCHGLRTRDVDRDGFERMLTEADTVSPLGTSLFDSLIGLAVRERCAPVLDLPKHAPADDYLARRAALGAREVNRRFLRGTGSTDYLLDGGFLPESLTATTDLAELADARAHDIVRLEQVAEDVIRGTSAAGFAEDFAAELDRRTATAVGVKSIAAYRAGLELTGERPAPAEVEAAAGRWLSRIEAGEPVRLAEEVLHRHLIWAGIDRRLPVQFHVGYGDSDVDLHRCDPLRLTGLLRATRDAGVPILLLHNYPFHRNAAYLAQVFAHVFVDVGLITHNAGFRAPAILAETLELAPFGKLLFSTDAFGLAELYHLGTALFRQGLSDFLRTALAADALSEVDAIRLARLAGHENATRIYRLERK